MDDLHSFASPASSMTVPGEVAAAIVAVQGDIKALARGDRNAHSNYEYTSVDDFYAAVAPIMSKHGLAVLSSCIASQVVEGKKTPNLQETWLFWAVHSGGSIAGPFQRSATVPALGAQAHGSSESYATKQFLRGLFKVPTGDRDDPDQLAPEEHAPGRKSSAQAKRDGDDKKIRSILQEAIAVDDLDGRWAFIEEEYLPKLPQSWRDPINDIYLKRREELQATSA